MKLSKLIATVTGMLVGSAVPIAAAGKNDGHSKIKDRHSTRRAQQLGYIGRTRPDFATMTTYGHLHATEPGGASSKVAHVDIAFKGKDKALVDFAGTGAGTTQ